MFYLLTIKADTNDADYVTSVHSVTKEVVDQLLPVFEAIRGFKPYNGTTKSGLVYSHNHNWPFGDGEYIPREDLGEKYPKDIYAGILTEGQCELFNQYAPFGEYGIHSIKEVKVLEVLSETVYV